MPSKRTPLNRNHRAAIRSQEMLDKVVRLLELMDAHSLAITRSTPETELFYTDGRHDELQNLLPEVTIPLGIFPHQDIDVVLRTLLAEAGVRDDA